MSTLFTQAELEEKIAASVTGGLNETEKNELDLYLSQHPQAQTLKMEMQVMNQSLGKLIKSDQPAPEFEQRMVSRFRRDARGVEGGKKIKIPVWQHGPLRAWSVVFAILVLSFYFGGSAGNDPSGPIANYDGRKRENPTPKADRAMADRIEDQGIYLESSKPGVVLSGYVDSGYAYGAKDEEKNLLAKKEDTNGWKLGLPNVPESKSEGQNYGYIGKVDEKRVEPHYLTQTPLETSNILDDSKPAGHLSSAGGIAQDQDSLARSNSNELTKSSVLRHEAKSGSASDIRSDLNVPASSNAIASIPASTSSVAAEIQRKLIRNASVNLEVNRYADSVRDLTALATELGGYISTQDDHTQANRRTAGEMVIKLPPDHLDGFLLKLRDLGAIKSQVLKTEDVTKAYFDTEARLGNARKTEQRLLELMEKKTDKVSDLLQVEKEMARVRDSIEQMQGELKLWDSLSLLATVTIELTEKDLDQAAAYLLKENANLALYSPDVEKTYQSARDLAEKAQAQILTSAINRQDGGQITASLSLLALPETSWQLIEQLKALGRVSSYTMNTERVAQDGQAGVPAGTTRRDKVQIDVVIQFDDASRKTITLQVITSEIEKALDLGKKTVFEAHGEVMASNFSRNPDGHASALLKVRVPANQVDRVQGTFTSFGRVAQLVVERQDTPGADATNEDTAPVVVALTLSDEETPTQETRLWVQGREVSAKVEALKSFSQQAGFELRSSSFEKNAEGLETAHLIFRVTGKNYPQLLQKLQETGQTLTLTLKRHDQVQAKANAEGSEPVVVDFTLISAPSEVTFQEGLLGSIRLTLIKSFALAIGAFERIMTGAAYLLPWGLLGALGYALWKWWRTKRR